MKLLHKILVPLAVGAVAMSAHAAVSSTTTTTHVSTPDLTLSSNWQERMYTNVSGGYIQSRDVDGGGAHVALGYEMAKSAYGTHNLEFEVGALFETGSNSKNNPGIVEGPKNANSKVDFDQFPMMLNYRFIGNFGDAFSKVTWYAGAGLGVNIVKYKNRFNGVYTELGVDEDFSFTQTKTEGEFAAQGFAGLGYALTPSIDLNVGVRALGTTRYTFSPENALPADEYIDESYRPYLPGQIRTNQIHWMVEAGLTFKF